MSAEGRHLLSEGRCIKGKRGTCQTESGTYHPRGGVSKKGGTGPQEGCTYHLRGGISRIMVVPISWRAAYVSRRSAPIM